VENAEKRRAPKKTEQTASAEVGSLMYFLASDGAGAITDQAFSISGGTLA
jgi:hypothetical protein